MKLKIRGVQSRRMALHDATEYLSSLHPESDEIIVFPEKHPGIIRKIKVIAYQYSGPVISHVKDFKFISRCVFGSLCPVEIDLILPADNFPVPDYKRPVEQKSVHI